ncbi:MAG TPA: hypothetical protein VFX44_11445 [Solirubrobacterales bacterium]|nr:hypothetical protein [Solirubrobacterales bacterium]
MRRRGAAASALALVALACLPASAGANGGSGTSILRRPPIIRTTRFELQGSNGYSILIASGSRQHVMVKTTSEGEELVTEYVTRDLLAAPDRVRAKLPGLIAISVRFYPRGPLRHPSPPGCKGRRPAVQHGVVRGTIRFIGERGYTRVEAHEANAEIEEATSWRCSAAAAQPEPPPPTHETWTSKFSAQREGVYLLVRKYPPGAIEGGEVLYSADAGEIVSMQPKLFIYRHATIAAPASTFADAHPERLAVSPPAPFAGTGRLSRTPESVFTWEGDLTVQFPGIDPVPLAGPGFGSDYCIREVGCIQQSFDSHS